MTKRIDIISQNGADEETYLDYLMEGVVMKGKTIYYYSLPMDWWEKIHKFTGRWFIKEDYSGRRSIYMEVEIKNLLWVKKEFVDSDCIRWETIYPIQVCYDQ